MPIEDDSLRDIAGETRGANLKIIHVKGATYYGVGTVRARIGNAILRDDHAVAETGIQLCSTFCLTVLPTSSINIAAAEAVSFSWKHAFREFRERPGNRFVCFRRFSKHLQMVLGLH
jgi:hypothetical protein